MKLIINYLRDSILISLLLIIIVAFSNISLLSQNESGFRVMNKPYISAKGYWVDSTNKVFQEEYPIIRSIPPLSMNMPLDVLYSYIYLDSLARFATNNQIDSLIDSWTNFNDTLSNALKYLYILKDYNPIIFNQYIWETELHYKKESASTIKKRAISDTNYHLDSAGFIRKPYKAGLFKVMDLIINKTKDLLRTDKDKAIFYGLLYADYILRISVLKIDSAKTGNSPNFNSWKVTALVLDTIKGKCFNTVKYYYYGYYPQPSELDCINFQYCTNTIFQISDDIPLLSGLSTPIDYCGKHGFSMYPGQEAVVFLRFINPRFNNTSDFFDIYLNKYSFAGAIPINNKGVKDINKLLSNDDYIEYSDWKNLLQNKINDLLNNNLYNYSK
jgi:hypothetical protein